MAILCAASVSACSSNQGIYNPKDPKQDKFSVENTVGLAIGAVAVVALAGLADGNMGGGSTGVKYRGYQDTYDWDYLPGSNQYRCRIVPGYANSGQFADDWRCASATKIDQWY